MSLLRRLIALCVLAMVFLITSSLGGVTHSIFRQLPPSTRQWIFGSLAVITLATVGWVIWRRRRRPLPPRH